MHHRPTVHHRPAVLPTAFTLVAEHPRPHLRLLQVAGELDLETAPRLRDAALDGGPDARRDVVVGLGAVTFMAAAGVNALLECRQALRTVVLAAPDRGAVARTLAAARLDELFPRFPSAAAALASLR